MGLDSRNMLGVLRDSPNQFARGLKLAGGAGVRNCNRVVLLGMGGSAMPGDLLNLCYGTQIETSREYDAPRVDGRTLVLACSYSGNTEETLSAAKQAFSQGGKLVCVATGGKLKAFAREFRLPFVELPNGLQPRCATGYFFSSIAKALSNSGFLGAKDAELLALGRALAKSKAEARAKAVARKLEVRIPVFYSAKKWSKVARVCKIKINENSKQPAFYNYLPEANHNEMVGFTNPVAKFTAVFLHDASGDKRVEKRMKTMAALLKKKGVQAVDFEMRGKSVLEKCFLTLQFFDWVSYWLAMENGVDPTPVKMVEDFKKKISG